MKTHWSWLVLLAASLTACTSGEIHFVKIDDTLNAYASAIRWGAFEKAASFMDPTDSERLDEAWLSDIQVTGYDQQYRKDQGEGNIVEQTVEIRYLHKSTNVEKILTDHQLWRWNEERGKLYLRSGLPKFR